VAVLAAPDGADPRVLLPQGGGDGADLGGGAGSEDDALGAALGDGRAAVGDVEPVARSRGRVKDVVLGLPNGQALAREQGLVRLEVLGLGEPDVGRDRVARLDLDQVSRHDLPGRHDDGLAAADDGGRGRAEAAQRVHRLLGRVLLEKAH
jgi:hypothetical protein